LLLNKEVGSLEGFMYVTRDTNRKARLNFVNWYRHEVHDEETGPKRVLLSCENWFNL